MLDKTSLKMFINQKNDKYWDFKMQYCLRSVNTNSKKLKARNS